MLFRSDDLSFNLHALCMMKRPGKADKNVNAVDKAPLAEADPIVYL